MEIKPGISLATVSAVLHTKDNKHVLQVSGEAGLGCKRNLQGLWGLEPFLLRRCRHSSQLPGQCCPHQQMVEVRLPEGPDLKGRALLISLAMCLGERKERRNNYS